MTKEAVYDEKIAPLIAQVIAICQEYKIATVMTFSLDGDMCCTSCLTSDDYEPHDELRTCVRTLLGGDGREEDYE